MANDVKKRKRAGERSKDITNAIAMLTAGQSDYATLTEIAKHIGLTPSTHLMNICKRLWIAGKISCTVKEDTRAGVVYHWWLSQSQYSKNDKLCQLPVSCFAEVDTNYNQVCRGKDGIICSALVRIQRSNFGDDSNVS